MSKLSISFKKYESYFTIFIGKKELISKSGTSIKFKNLRLVEKCINKLNSFSTYDEIYNSNLIKNCIYKGRVFHFRKRPKKHSFKYNYYEC